MGWACSSGAIVLAKNEQNPVFHSRHCISQAPVYDQSISGCLGEGGQRIRSSRSLWTSQLFRGQPGLYDTCLENEHKTKQKQPSKTKEQPLPHPNQQFDRFQRAVAPIGISQVSSSDGQLRTDWWPFMFTTASSLSRTFNIFIEVEEGPGSVGS